MRRHRVALNAAFWRAVESRPGRVVLAVFVLAWLVVLAAFMAALAFYGGPN